MSKFTLQGILNKNVTKLRAQNKRSIGFYKDEYGEIAEGCAYRGSDGCRCAIGHMIPNKYYRKWMEGFIPDNHEDTNNGKLYNVLIEIGYTDKQIDFMRKLQQIHDFEDLWNTREKRWQELASLYKLTLPPVDGE